MQLICIFSIISVTILVQAGIPYNRVNFQLYDDPTFESQVINAVREAKRVFQEVEVAAKVAQEALNYVPYVGSVVNQGVQSIVSDKANQLWLNAMTTSIANETQRSIARAKMIDIKVTMLTISQNFRSLETPNKLSTTDKIAIVHIIRNEIQKMLNTFAIEDSIFRSFPQLTIRPLSALSLIISAFETIMRQFTPNLESFYSCKFNDILFDYRHLLIQQRLNKLESYTHSGIRKSHTDISNIKAFVFGRPYNTEGYSQTRDQIIQCEEVDGCDDHCLKDLVTSKKYVNTGHTRTDAMHCFTGYVEMLRFKIEKVFKEPIHLMKGICSDEIRAKRRKTGKYFIWISIIYTFF